MQIEKVALKSGSFGSESSLTLWRYGVVGARPKVYLQAGLHADEWPGMLVLHHLHQKLSQATVHGEVLIVPVANPVGLRQFIGGYQLGRFDFDYTGNFNRAYLDLSEAALPLLSGKSLNKETIRHAFSQALQAWQPELESDYLRKTLQLLCVDADIMLDLHCDAQACLHAFANEKQRKQAELLAQCMELSALILEEDLHSMAFDEAFAAPWWRLAEKLGVEFADTPFAATIELRGEREISDALAVKDSDGIMRFLAAMGVVDTPPDLATWQPIGTPLAGVARLTAPVAALVSFRCCVGEVVRKGQCVAELIDALDPTAPRIDLRSPTDGVVYALGRNHMVRAGHVVAQIAGKAVLGRGKLAF